MKTTIKTIVNSMTNGAYQRPCSWAELDCGHTAETAEVGTVVDCERCDRFAETLAKVPDWKARSCHTRYRKMVIGQIYFYAPAAGSPSGVQLIGQIEARPEVYALLEGSSKAPLSPTEGLSRR